MSLVVDFGTTNTVVAEWTDDGPATLRLDRLSRTPDSGMPPVIPSLLYVEKATSPARVLAGQDVIAAGQDNKTDPRFFASFKRALAAEYREPPRQIDGVAVSYEQAGEWFLARVLQAVRQTGRGTDSVLFTLPVRSFETYATWLSSVSSGLGVKELQILDESTAAALGYEVDRSRVPVLVFDFGGGTLDVSTIRTPDLSQSQVGFFVRLGRLFGGSKEEKRQVEEGTATVLGKACEVLGGEDIDLWIGDAVLQAYGKTRADISMVERQFKNSAEATKIALSNGGSATFSCFDAATGQPYNRDFSRSNLEDILDRQGFFTTIQKCVDSALRQAELENIQRKDLKHVALTGGSSQIPSVQRALRQLFGDRVQSHKPFEAVAHGALRATRGIKVDDFLYHSYGIEGWNSSQVEAHNGERGAYQYDVVFHAGERYPSGEVERRYPCAERNQEAIDLTVGEIDHGIEQTGEVVFEQGQIRLRNAHRRNRHVERAEGRDSVFDVVEHRIPAWSESKRIGGPSTHSGAPPAVGAPTFAQPFVWAQDTGLTFPPKNVTLKTDTCQEL